LLVVYLTTVQLRVCAVGLSLSEKRKTSLVRNKHKSALNILREFVKWSNGIPPQFQRSKKHSPTF
jgi:hypothetical protein